MPDYPYIIQLSKKTEPSINAERNARTRQDKEIINNNDENNLLSRGICLKIVFGEILTF